MRVGAELAPPGPTTVGPYAASASIVFAGTWSEICARASSLSREYEIQLAPVFLRRRAFCGPVRRVIELVGHLRRPEASDMAVEDVALYRLTQSGGAARLIGFPARREHERAAEWEMRLCRLLRGTLLQRHHVLRGFRHRVGDAMGFAVDRLQMCHRTASAFASSRSNRARNAEFRSESSP